MLSLMHFHKEAHMHTHTYIQCVGIRVLIASQCTCITKCVTVQMFVYVSSIQFL